ncbi:phage tail protein [Paraburkholderia sp. BR10936]|uniref:phage tail protein n=1 Tax=Paraburkholderia sp. BR10936 TaxID=3236993 RepID=UPI0034D21F39
MSDVLDTAGVMLSGLVPMLTLRASASDISAALSKIGSTASAAASSVSAAISGGGSVTGALSAAATGIGGALSSGLSQSASELLSGFNFSLNTAVYQSMRRSTQYVWGEQSRFGQRAARQFVRVGDDTLTLPGVIYPEWKGSSSAMGVLRKMGSAGIPYLMMDAQGYVYGRWTIESVEETKSEFAAFNQPKKIEFVVTLKMYDGQDGSLLANALQGTLIGNTINQIQGIL